MGALGCDTVDVKAGKAQTGEIGAVCEAPEDCAGMGVPAPNEGEDDERLCLRMPDGYCATKCFWQLDCPSQSICDDLGDPLSNFCLDGCLSNEDCRAEYWCDFAGGKQNLSGEAAGICRAKCQGDGGCRPGFRCSDVTGSCVPADGEAVGAPCTEDGDCRSGSCLASFPGGGYCTAACGDGQERCEQGSVCVPTGGAVALCMPTCELQAEGASGCRDGYACLEKSERGVCFPRCDQGATCSPGEACDEGSGACVPDEEEPPPGESGCVIDPDCRPGQICEEGECTAACRDEICGDGFDCDGSTGRCVAEPPQDSEPAVTSGTTNLGNITVGSTPSAEVSFDVDADMVGAAIFATGTGAQLMTLAKLVAPGGRTLYDFGDPFAGAGLRVFPSDDPVTVLLPVTPRVPLTAGRYKLRFIRNGGEAPVSVAVRWKSAPDGLPRAASLDLVVHLVGLEGLDAASAPGHRALGQAMEVLDRNLGDAGVSLGEITYVDPPAAAARRLSIIQGIEGPDSELAELFALSAGHGEGKLHFFLVEEIIGGDAGFILLGIAGGIPGPPLAGTAHSGVAVTAADLPRRGTQIGLTMAHEAGHFLGLFHTSERNGSSHDPIPDTPECLISRDANDDGFLLPDECNSRGSDNLLFWAADPDADGLSADQGWVLARNPIIH